MTQDETTGEYQYVVALTLSDEGAQKFAQATTAMVGETHLHLDGRRDALCPHGKAGHHQRRVRDYRRLHQRGGHPAGPPASRPARCPLPCR